jgi:hypothetical protein
MSLDPKPAMSLDPKPIELAVLYEVVELHPTHLPPSELVRRMSEGRDEDKQLEGTINTLKAADLLREKSGVIEPTQAALHATAVLTH